MAFSTSSPAPFATDRGDARGLVVTGTAGYFCAGLDIRAVPANEPLLAARVVR